MPGNKSFCLAYPSSGLLLITLIALILPSPITPSLDICNTVFSKVSLLINLILEGSMYSIKKIWSFNISLVGSEIKIISPNFKMVEPMRVVCDNFIKCLRKKIIPYSNGKFATEIIRIVNKIHNNLI